ncbi:MAG: HAMP domain-containing histidine kinase [Oscillospiraceae bacterium]|nr:HAMP domain-containing histidine kinase [Oscillospiraceae bacterium]
MSHKSIKLVSGIQRRWIVNVLAVSLLLVLSVMTALAIVVSNYYYTALMSSLESRASMYASFVSKNYLSNYDTYTRNINTIASDFEDKDKMELQFITSAGRLQVSASIAASGLTVDTPDVKNALQTGEPRSYIGANINTGERVMAVSAPICLQNGSAVGAVRCVTSLERADTRILQFVGWGALVSVLFLAVMLSANFLFIRGILIPMQEINKVAKRIAEGGYGARIEKSYRDEMGELVDNINHMSGEIRAAERMKSDFISSVSHELRTPLTAISGWGETLLSTDMNDPGEMRKGVRVMLKETSRLAKMVEELLDFTRIEGGRLTLNVEPFDLAPELEEIAYLHMDALKREGITLTYSQPDQMPEVSGDRARLKQVFVNILDNAAKHGGGGKRIDAALDYDEAWVTITVRDYGQGIPESELPHVKYMFYKGSAASRGSGIGLAVSDEIVRVHGGELLIESAEGEGTTVTVRLPRAEETERIE